MNDYLLGGVLLVLAGVTHEEWVAARLQAAALIRAVDTGDPDAVKYVLARPGSRSEDASPRARDAAPSADTPSADEACVM